MSRSKPMAVRKLEREELLRRVSRPGKEMLRDQMAILDLSGFTIIRQSVIDFHSVLFLLRSSDGRLCRFYDHRPEIIDKVEKFLNGKLSRFSLLQAIQSECRVESIKKTDDDKVYFYFNVYSRPAKEKAKRTINVSEIMSHFK